MHAKRSRSQMEIAFQRLEAHMLFICPECGDTYQTQQQWRQHLNYNHDYLCKTPEDFNFTEVSDRYHECKSCNVMVADGKRAIALLQYHRFLHLPYSRTYRCRHCSVSFTRKRVLCEHLCRNHEKNIGEKLTTSTVKNLSSTIKPISQESSKTGKGNAEFYMRYLCPQCGKIIDDYKAWVLHIKTIHADTVRADCEMQKISGTKNYNCRICHKVVQGNDNARLQRHYFTHMPYKILFLCTFCKVRRAYKTELLHHFIRTHIKEFETHKKLIRKPIEWGADANEKLDKELDLLLKHGSGIGSSKGPSSMHLTSTTILNSFSRTSQPIKTSSMLCNQENSKKDNGKLFRNSFDSDDSFNRSNTSSKEISKRKSNETIKSKSLEKVYEIKKTQKKNELEALCAEIFDDIDMETALLSQNISKFTHDNNNKIVEGPNNLNLNGNTQEEIIKIEINALNEEELNQLETGQYEMNSLPSSKRQKLSVSIESGLPVDQHSNNYKTLKSLFHAKILHLCPKCGKQFNEQSSWREHVLHAHENLNKMIEDSFKHLDDQNANLCLNCMQVLPTTNKSELQRHCFTHMPFHTYLKCTICGSSKSNKSKMLSHLETEHNSLIQATTKMNKFKQSTVEISAKMEIEKDIKERCSLPSNLKNSGYHHHLMRHLLNAHDRLNRIAAGIEAL